MIPYVDDLGCGEDTDRDLTLVHPQLALDAGRGETILVSRDASPSRSAASCNLVLVLV
jgi:hypothetical protein